MVIVTRSRQEGKWSCRPGILLVKGKAGSLCRASSHSAPCVSKHEVGDVSEEEESKGKFGMRAQDWQGGTGPKKKGGATCHS